MPKCRICGCTDDNACMPERCFWLDDDLCSSCAGKSLLHEYPNPAEARDRIEASIMLCQASMAMAGEFFCEICATMGDDQAKIEACPNRPCGFRDDATGEIDAPYLEHPQLQTVVKNLEAALATLPPAPRPSSIILP